MRLCSRESGLAILAIYQRCCLREEKLPTCISSDIDIAEPQLVFKDLLLERTTEVSSPGDNTNFSEDVDLEFVDIKSVEQDTAWLIY